jgi:hypothetical protein
MNTKTLGGALYYVTFSFNVQSVFQEFVINPHSRKVWVFAIDFGNRYEIGDSHLHRHCLI